MITSKDKAIVVYSGGLDSRLVVKILQNQGLSVEALFFKLPFDIKGIDEKINDNNNFAVKHNFKFTVIDCAKGDLFKGYLKLLKKPKYPRGRSVNNCIDCKEFIFSNAFKYAQSKGIEIIASGEVVGQRPVSQRITAIRSMDNDMHFDILRPLSAKLLEPTVYEKNGLVDRESFFDFEGRSRHRQIALAKSYGIDYPGPAGGCILCEKNIGDRIIFLLDKDLITEHTLPLTLIGRHYYIDTWYVVGRDKAENDIIEQYDNVIQSGKGKPAVFYHQITGKKMAHEIQQKFINKNYSSLAPHIIKGISK